MGPQNMRSKKRNIKGIVAAFMPMSIAIHARLNLQRLFFTFSPLKKLCN